MKGAFFVGIGLVVLVGASAFFLMVPSSPAPFFAEVAPKSLSLREAVGQTLLIGFEGREMNPELKGLIKKFQPGGVLLLARNIEKKQLQYDILNRTL